MVINRTVDVNCDMGEGFGIYSLGQDRKLLRFVSSVNIACGFHAGDPSVMRETIAMAKEANVSIGAHPGYPDLQGFGRRQMQLTPNEVYDLVVYQVAAFLGVAKALGVEGTHVKVHGALYNKAASDIHIAEAVATAVRNLDEGLVLVGLAGSRLVEMGAKLGLKVSREAFFDRRYDRDGSLVPRSHHNACYQDVQEAQAQARAILTSATATAFSGEDIRVLADTLCIHGDSPNALEFARGLSNLLAELDVSPVGLRRG